MICCVLITPCLCGRVRRSGRASRKGKDKDKDKEKIKNYI